MAFSTTGRAPGVYMQEVDVPGAIAGVGTSTAAFLGPARSGPIGEPTFLTGWTGYVETFGRPDAAGPYFPGEQVYLPHAVRGFFDNGGRGCYVVRVGDAAAAWLDLTDAGGAPALRLTARTDGEPAEPVTVEVTAASLGAAVVARGATTLTAAVGSEGTTATVEDPAPFAPGDRVVLGADAAARTAVLTRVDGKELTFEQAPGAAFASGDPLRIDDLPAGARLLRLVPPDGATRLTGIGSGSVLRLTAGAQTQDVVVGGMDLRTGIARLDTPLTADLALDPAGDEVRAATVEFALTVAGTSYPGLSMDPRHGGYVLRALREDAPVVPTLAEPPSASPATRRVLAPAASRPLAGGRDDGPPAGHDDGLYREALAALLRIDDVNLVCVPDRPRVAADVLEHCATAGDRFAVLDPLPGESIGAVTARRNGGGDDPGLVSEKGFGALYYPWIRVADPFGDGLMAVPPSGHVAGLIARTDDALGVFAPPANAVLAGARGLTQVLTDGEQGPLNDLGINVIRSFPGRGIRVWGARTLATVGESQWRYVNVRRLVLFVEESIQEATAYAVLKPNNTGLWGQLTRQVTEFLGRVYAAGGLVGDTPEAAFSVRIDEELNPPAMRQLGVLTIEVRMYPVTPAEYVVFRIVQEPGGPVIQE